MAFKDVLTNENSTAVDASNDFVTALISACNTGNIQSLQFCLQEARSQDYNQRSYPTVQYLLQCAARNGQADVVRYLFNNAPECVRQNPSKPWSPPLPIPSVYASAAEMSEECPWPTSEDGVIFSAMDGSDPVAVFKVFFEYSMSPNQLVGRGWSLLYCTVRRNPELAELIVRKGANVNEKLFRGDSLLGLAAGWQSPEMIDLFVKCGASVRQSQALKNSAFYRRTCNMEKLLRLGADINEIFTKTFYNPDLKEENLGAALHCAIQGGRSIQNNPKADPPEDAVRFLLQHGARTDLRDGFGRKPLSLARRLKRKQVIEVFKEMGLT